MRWPVERVLLWQQQPERNPGDWAQVLGELFPPAVGGPLPPEQQPHIDLVLPGDGIAALPRPEVVRLVDALQGWLARTSWTAELPAAPDPAARTTSFRSADGLDYCCRDGAKAYPAECPAHGAQAVDDEPLTHDDHPDCTLCGHPYGPHTPLGPDGRGSCTRCIERYRPAQQCPGYAL